MLTWLVDENAVFARVDVHCETDEHHKEETNDEGTAFAYSIREVGSDYGEDGGGDVDGDSEKLGLGARIVQVLDDGGQKQTDAIKWADDLIE